MTDKELKELQVSLMDGSLPNGLPCGVARLIVDELASARKEKEWAVACLTAVTNCGYCTLCQERHGKK